MSFLKIRESLCRINVPMYNDLAKREGIDAPSCERERMTDISKFIKSHKTLIENNTSIQATDQRFY